MAGKMVTIDGNEATARIAYMFSDVAAIYPITPSSVMGELSDAWAAMGRKNLFGEVVEVAEMEHEGGAAGAVHGSLVAGALTTTFTASQGLLLMIPNMYKIAGEMIPTVFHVSARSLAAQSLAIFGDHSDVMAARQTGFAMIAATSVQNCYDTALVSHLATLKSDVPFLNFFDGFRTSHEVQKVEDIDEETVKTLIEPEYIEKFRKRALRPEAAMCRVGAQNSDVYFQGRETTNLMYDKVPEIVQEYFQKIGEKTGRKQNIMDYYGAEDADTVVVVMGSGVEVVEEAVKYINNKCQCCKAGMVTVRLYRPFATEYFKKILPATVKNIVVLDRTKEPGSNGEPLYLDVVEALKGSDIRIIGGRYGLSSKEFTPGMAVAVFRHGKDQGFHGFTVGINDDVSHRSISYEEIDVSTPDTVSCMFWGLGSDGTVGANKQSIKIIGDYTNKYAQAYFFYDSKKSYGITVSHLRFGDSPIQAPYLITNPDFVACHNAAYIGRYDMLSSIKVGGTFLLNSEWSNEEAFENLTANDQKIIRERNIKFYNINALSIAKKAGLGSRINTVMQAAFFKLANILPEAESIELIKKGIQKAYGKKGEEIVNMNCAAVDATAAALGEVKILPEGCKYYVPPRLISENADQFAKDIIEPLMHLKGDDVPVSKMSYDGIIPTGTTCLEKRGIAPQLPTWDSTKCIQCNQCVQACPHAAIRAKQIEPKYLENKPESFVAIKSNTRNDKDLQYRIQVYIEDCTGCGVCIETCPAKEKALSFTTLAAERAAGQNENVEFFEKLPENVTDGANLDTVKGAMFLQPLFEFSGACAGCGETPYIKQITQLFGERMIIANATGCTSIYGGTFPTIPYTKSKISGYGPAWGNSLFEDNAEYGLGMRLAVDNNRKILKTTVNALLEAGTTAELTAALTAALEGWDKTDREAINLQKHIAEILPAAQAAATDANRTLVAKVAELKDYFVDKSVWIFGGDGWAYDIGYGGLDHVLAMGRNVNVLVVDTEVYSNTGGQASKSTPIAAVAKFATAGMRLPKKNLGLMMMSYGYVYVASVAMGANRNQVLKAMKEAEAYNGPSIIIAYAPCIAHGINMMKTQVEQKRAVECGYWPLYRYNPAQEKPFTWETPEPKGDFQEFIRSEARYKQLTKTAPAEAEELYAKAQADAKRRMDFFKKMAEMQ